LQALTAGKQLACCHVLEALTSSFESFSTTRRLKPARYEEYEDRGTTNPR
jgi:hypothetical protein